MLDSLVLTRKAIPGIERKFAGLTIENITADGSFSGYASLFGEVDLGKDSVEAGAFLKSVRERGPSGIRMLWQHDPNQPIGVWTQVREDKRGLYVEGKLAKGVAKAQEVLELMRSGAVDGLSIGFKTVRAKADGAGVRHIHEADLWEISVVTFPMLPSARVGQVKSAPPAKQMPTYTHQPRLLWNIKANELLLSALKRAAPSDYNRRWIENLEAETLEMKRRSTLYETFQHWLSLKFDPNQRRVPAGNSDGGQWTDGGGNGGPASGIRFVSGHGRFGASIALPKKPDGPRAPDGTPVQLAQADSSGSRKYSIDLNEEEAPNGIGHTKRRHVAQSDEALKARMRADYFQMKTPSGKAVVWAEAYGSFDNEIDANDMINKVLQNNKQIVDAVSSGARAGAALNMRFGRPTGKEAYRPKSYAQPYMRPTFNVRVIIEHDNRTKRGYRVKTAMPCNDEQSERKP